ncbi:hypothetical protein KCG44_09140 [Pacificimonas sp. WHA3]|uniref:Uncharacterized protein n=1 Tax=Pacificimonas pallii TaxID=2827236 RepID=A0ABS6SEZ9_9SPHN|nr:hypothetical protein [Pacificimonas pallii]MBV7256945.1 hypothetical protein [Pacificimonas pallii]
MSGGFNFDFGSIVNFAAQAALGIATGGTSMLATMAMQQIVSAIGQQVIQQLGQQLGLPQSIIDTAQGAFAGALGDTQGATQNYQEAISGFAEQFGMSPMDEGNILRAADSLYSKLDEVLQEFMQSNARGGRAASQGQGAGGAGEGGVQAADGLVADVTAEGGFLVKLAALLGEVLDKKMEQMGNLAESINQIGEDQSSFGEVDEGNMAEFDSMKTDLMSKSALLQGVAQELKVLNEALTTALKSIGEAQQASARKQ